MCRGTFTVDDRDRGARLREMKRDRCANDAGADHNHPRLGCGARLAGERGGTEKLQELASTDPK